MFFQSFRVEENCAPKLHFVVLKMVANTWVPGMSDNISNIQSFVNYVPLTDRTDPVVKERKNII